MTTIFISNSKRDEELVLNVKRILENVDHTQIIEEFVQSNEQSTIPYEDIRANVERSGFVFLFLTDNVMKTEYTKNWVIYEVGVASANSKRIFVFERVGNPKDDMALSPFSDIIYGVLQQETVFLLFSFTNCFCKIRVRILSVVYLINVYS